MTDKYQELIDDYLRGRLGEEQRREVDRLADEDENFRAELDFHKQTKSAFASQKHDHLKKRLQSLSSEGGVPLQIQRPIKRLGRPLWLVAASLLLVCSVGIYIWSLQRNEVNPADLYVAYFEPYPNVAHPVTRDEVQLSERALAYSYYEQEEYAQAYELFDSLQKGGTTDDPEILFYQGISALELDLNDEAITLFKKYRAEDNATLNRQAIWYEALAGLKQGNTNESRVLLQYLAENQGYKQTEAIRLLAQY